MAVMSSGRVHIDYDIIRQTAGNRQGTPKAIVANGVDGRRILGVNGRRSTKGNHNRVILGPVKLGNCRLENEREDRENEREKS